jgi:HEAT repeat protein
VRSAACRALGKVGTGEDVPVLAKLMTIDATPECRIAAIDGLGDLKTRDPRVEQLLVENMDHNDPAVRVSALRSLRKITGQDLGVETAPWRKLVDEKLAAQQKTDAEAQRASAATDRDELDIERSAPR